MGPLLAKGHRCDLPAQAWGRPGRPFPAPTGPMASPAPRGTKLLHRHREAQHGLSHCLPMQGPELLKMTPLLLLLQGRLRCSSLPRVHHASQLTNLGSTERLNCRQRTTVRIRDRGCPVSGLSLGGQIPYNGPGQLKPLDHLRQLLLPPPHPPEVGLIPWHLLQTLKRDWAWDLLQPLKWLQRTPALHRLACPRPLLQMLLKARQDC